MEYYCLAPEVGLEPTTQRLTAVCSTTELLRNTVLADYTERGLIGQCLLPNGCLLWYSAEAEANRYLKGKMIISSFGAQLCYQPYYGLIAPIKRRKLGVEVLSSNPSELKKYTQEEQKQYDLEAVYTASRQLADWNRVKLYQVPIELSVNTPSEYYEDPEFFWDITKRVEAIAPHLITLEVLEGSPINMRSKIVQTNLRRLRDHGIQIALDDVGTGCVETRDQVQRLLTLAFGPRRRCVTKIKIDRSLTEGLNTPFGMRRIREFVSLAQRYNVGVVAEGVTTNRQVDKLLGLYPNDPEPKILFQGWGIAKKMPPNDLEDWVERLKQGEALSLK